MLAAPTKKKSKPIASSTVCASSVGLFLGLIVVALAGCSSITPRREVSAPSSVPQQRFWLLADTQLHNVAGESTRSRSKAIDLAAKVAIRPPTLDLWAGVILASILDKIKADGERPVFFLGDAANISCITEYERFLGEMKQVPWFGVLGNHDGLYMGNLTYLPDYPDRSTGPNKWSGACLGESESEELVGRMSELEKTLLGHGTAEVGTHASQGTLSKTNAAWMYLNHLRQDRGLIAEEPLEADSWKREYDMLVFRAAGKYQIAEQEYPVAVVSAISMHPQTAWKAYVLQDVTLPDRTHVLMIDTSDYLNLPTVARVLSTRSCGSLGYDNSAPGLCGEVGEHQMREIGNMTDKWDKGARFFVLGHHPWQSLRRDTTDRLDALREKPGFIAYISGHTHYSAATVAPDDKEHWELNIGSTTDAPREYVQLGFRFVTEGQGAEAELDVTRHQVRPMAQDGGYAGLAVCPKAERREELRYGTPRKYLNRALSVYEALLEGLPAEERQKLGPAGIAKELERAKKARETREIGKKREALAALIKFDRKVLQSSPWVRDVERECAVWASDIEGKRNGEGKLDGSITLKDRTIYRVKLPQPRFTAP